eukprot:CAMPEP_0206245662 /NCGR_PEP_ID=MMETSP0047_2-20121206/18818_1 /ASSEMBLY_ACC=CAM_ASM_000192 /TAXON_ID=195065 /ORGANISM="Chroomonas mesostigmatica_cf, Strain CCMP1168" /LENGTH=83 /DNA_ID=CAMNT_0053670979 /DNA_START=17 /DNA_END=268 /DNA_ORIENTATION=+
MIGGFAPNPLHAAQAYRQQRTMLAGPHFFTDALKDDSSKVMPSAQQASSSAYDPISAALKAHGDAMAPKKVKSGSFFGVNTQW